jgi:hypothetical protein
LNATRKEQKSGAALRFALASAAARPYLLRARGSGRLTGSPELGHCRSRWPPEQETAMKEGIHPLCFLWFIIIMTIIEKLMSGNNIFVSITLNL